MATRGCRTPARGLALAIGLALSAVVAACSTPAPSPEPTATAAPTPNAALAELAVRVRDGLTEQGGFVRLLGEASAGDPGRLRIVAHSIRLWTEDEIAWLDDHPSEACFADAHDAYRAAVEEIAAGAAAFEAIAAATAPPSDAEGQAAVKHVDDARTQMETASSLALTARAACG